MSLKVKNLSREQKIELIKLAEEKAKRDLRRRPKYKPNAGQFPIHQSKANFRFVFSGNGSGKSTALVNEIHWAATGVNPTTGERTPVPAKMILVVDNSKKVEEVILPEYRKWHELDDEMCKRQGKPYISQIQYPNGSTLSIYTAEADPMTFEGVQATHIFIDEPVTRNLYIALRRALRIKNMPTKLLFVGTAISQAWLRREIYEPWAKGELDDTECFTVGTHVNKDNLPPDYIDTFSKVLSEAEQAVRLKGGFFDSQSLALGHLWDRSVHIVHDLPWDPNWPVIIGVDPHMKKPHTMIMVGADRDNNIFVLKELSAKQTAKQFAYTLKEWIKGYKVADIIIDSLGSGDMTGGDGFKSFIDVLHEEGIRCRATRYEEKSHEDLIDRLQTNLLIPETYDNLGRRLPKMRVHGSCKGLIADIESVTWVKNKTTGEYLPKLDTSAKDFLSALGYALSGNINNKRGEERPTYLKKAPYGLGLRSQRQMAVKVQNFRKKYLR